MDGDADAAPPVRLSSFSPIFPVHDLGRALAHYASLGFEVNRYGDELYGFADRDGVGLHLSAEGGHEHAGEHDHEHVGSAYLYVDDADALYERWARPGTGGLTRRVRDTPYKLREGSHVDLDGNLIRFGSPMPAKPAQLLRSQLERSYEVQIEAMTELDVGVWHIQRADGPDWVARMFARRRPAGEVQGDADILRYLQERGFPAERCAFAAAAWFLDGHGMLLTEWAQPVPRERRREAIRAAGGLRQLGALLGRLHTLLPDGDLGPGAVGRPGGAWHHLADGLPSAEVAAASAMLADAGRLFSGLPGGEEAAFAALQAEVASLDTGEGLPQALTHPDFVLANVVATDAGMVFVDWAGAGRGPRAWSLAFLLYAEGAKDLRRVDVVLDGYRRHVTLSPPELGRLAGLIVARPLVLTAWSVCTGRTTPSQAMAGLPELKTLAEAIAARARAALAR
jgi:Ser/Thr protein kinase RdoA (MazF antagonist)